MSTATSPAYDAAVYAPVRTTAATIGFDLAAPEAKHLAVLNAPPGTPFARPAQLLNGVEEPTDAIATFEPGLWRLDGSFVLPNPPEASDFEVGWWGEAQSDALGGLDNPCCIEITFPTVQKIPCIGLSFDARSNTALADFTVTLYGTAGHVLYREEISGNTAMTAQTRAGAEQVQRIIIDIYKTAAPYRHPRITEINFGFRLRFDDNDILEASLITEADPTAQSLPYPRLSASVRNDGRFNFLDPDDFSRYLQTRQTFEYRHGVVLPTGETEYIHRGVFYLEGWRVSDERIEFNAAGAAAALDLIPYAGLTYETLTLGALFARVCAVAGLGCRIDAAYYSTPLVCAYLGEITCREALVYLANLGCALVYEDSHNTLHMRDLLSADAPGDTLDYDNLLAPPALNQSPYYNGILLTEYTANPTGGGFTSTETFFPAPWHDSTEPPYGLSVVIPCLVANKNAQHAALRDWFLARKFALLSQRITAECSWRQNPALALNDTVTVQANKVNARVQAKVVQTSTDYREGVLSGETKALIMQTFM